MGGIIVQLLCTHLSFVLVICYWILWMACYAWSLIFLSYTIFRILCWTSSLNFSAIQLLTNVVTESHDVWTLFPICDSSEELGEVGSYPKLSTHRDAEVELVQARPNFFERLVWCTKSDLTETHVFWTDFWRLAEVANIVTWWTDTSMSCHVGVKHSA
jgi:hypothetical protein